jgi:hypothetical protein
MSHDHFSRHLASWMRITFLRTTGVFLLFGGERLRLMSTIRNVMIRIRRVLQVFQAVEEF